MIKKFLGFVVLIFAMATALVAYSMTGTVSETQGAVARYIQKAKTETLAIASPVLKKFGIDVKEIQPDNMNIVERQMENATDKVNEATQALSR